MQSRWAWKGRRPPVVSEDSHPHWWSKVRSHSSWRHSCLVLKGSGVIGQLNISLSQMWWRIWKPWTSPQPPLWCFARPFLPLSALVACLGVFLPSTFVLKTPKASWVAFAVCFGSLSIRAVKWPPANFAARGWSWAERTSGYSSEFTWRRLCVDVVKGFSPHHGKDSATIHHSCLRWTSRPPNSPVHPPPPPSRYQIYKLLIWPLLPFLLSLLWISSFFLSSPGLWSA